MVGRFPDKKLKRDVILGDESGQVTMVLWHQKASSIEFNQGDIVNIENAVTSTFNNSVMVSTSGETKITVIDEAIQVEVPPHLWARLVRSIALLSPQTQMFWRKRTFVVSIDVSIVTKISSRSMVMMEILMSTMQMLL